MFCIQTCLTNEVGCLVLTVNDEFFAWRLLLTQSADSITYVALSNDRPEYFYDRCAASDCGPIMW